MRKHAASRSWATFLLASVITARMSSRIRRFSRSIGPAALRPSRILRTTSSPRSGARTGAFRFIDWNEMRARNFAWWRQRVRGVKEIFHVFRIDHVLGFYRIYAFPWRPERNQEFLPLNHGRKCSSAPAAARRSSRRATIRRRKTASESPRGRGISARGFGGSRRDARGRRRSRHGAGLRPAQLTLVRHRRLQDSAMGNRARSAVVPGGSLRTAFRHDLCDPRSQTVARSWEDAFEKTTETSEQARGDLRRSPICRPSVARRADRLSRAIFIRPSFALFRSNSWLAIVMITDLLGRKDRFNVPGTAADSNWTRRLHTTVARLGRGHAPDRQLDLIREALAASSRLLIRRIRRLKSENEFRRTSWTRRRGSRAPTTSSRSSAEEWSASWPSSCSSARSHPEACPEAGHVRQDADQDAARPPLVRGRQRVGRAALLGRHRHPRDRRDGRPAALLVARGCRGTARPVGAGPATACCSTRRTRPRSRCTATSTS